MSIQKVTLILVRHYTGEICIRLFRHLSFQKIIFKLINNLLFDTRFFSKIAGS